MYIFNSEKCENKVLWKLKNKQKNPLCAERDADLWDLTITDKQKLIVDHDWQLKHGKTRTEWKQYFVVNHQFE